MSNGFAQAKMPVTPTSLLAAPPPRGDDLVERCIADAVAKTRRLARQMSIIFACFPVAVLALLGALASSDGNFEGATQVVVLVLIFGGAIPIWAIRAIILADVKALRQLARNGSAHRATGIRIRIGAYLQKNVDITWDEDGKSKLARFETRLQKLIPCHFEDVVVLSLPRKHTVLALLGDNGVFVGTRQTVLW